VEAGNVMRRTCISTQDAVLQEWCHVVALPMLERDSCRSIQGLQHCSSNSPAPFNIYAGEIASLYLQRNECSDSQTSSMVGPVVAFLETAQWSV